MTEYVSASTLTDAPGGQRLDLATALGATPTGLVRNPVFFTGFLARPDVAASGLLAVADVAAARYADPGLAARLASLDPVVTAGGTCLRFESFSACNSVHARFDLLPDGLGSSDVGFGTTNVDINPPLRTALARVHRAEALHLSVGRDELRASSLAGIHVERKVNLPERWVRGLAEVPALTAAMTPAAKLRGPAITRFFSTLARVAPPGPTMHVLPAPSGWRLSTRPVPGSFPIAGTARLRGADRAIRHATQLTVHVNDNGTTAWVFDVPGGHLTLVLSPDPYRGFSGEGTLLTLLTNPAAEAHGKRLLDQLGWAAVIHPADLAQRTGLAASEVAAGLAWLAASGRLGYDLTQHMWFHRELPIDADKILRRNPRLTAARTLLAGGAVTDAPNGWHVCGTHGNRYTVTHQLGCDCAWGIEHRGDRGPCKHVLAVLLGLRD